MDRKPRPYRLRRWLYVRFGLAGRYWESVLDDPDVVVMHVSLRPETTPDAPKGGED